jgi:uncharacterized protein YqeY
VHNDVTARLRTALTQALSSRDLIAAAAIRSALSAIGNAEAVPPPAGSASGQTSSQYIAGATAGLGAAEAARRELAEADIAAIVTAEINDRRHAADEYDGLGRADQSARLRLEADILAGVLAEPMTP